MICAAPPSSRSATGTQCHSCNTEGKGIARHRRSVSSICRTRRRLHEGRSCGVLLCRREDAVRSKIISHPSNRFRTGLEVVQMDPWQFRSGTSQAFLSDRLPTKYPKSPRGCSICGQAIKPADLWLRLHQQRLFPDLGPRRKCRVPRHVRSIRSSSRATRHSAPALWVLRILRLPPFCAV